MGGTPWLSVLGWVEAYSSVSRGVLSVPMPFPVLPGAEGGLGVRACVPRHSSVSSAVTPSSQLLVWVTSFQAGSQAPVCSLELIREEGAAKIPRQSWEAEGRERLALNSPSPGPLAGTGRAQKPKVGAQRQGESSCLLEGAEDQGGATPDCRVAVPSCLRSEQILCNSWFRPNEGPSGKGGNCK